MNSLSSHATTNPDYNANPNATNSYVDANGICQCSNSSPTTNPNGHVSTSNGPVRIRKGKQEHGRICVHAGYIQILCRRTQAHYLVAQLM
jgi:hypothetical protein